MTNLINRLSSLRNSRKDADDARLRKQGEIDALQAQLRERFGLQDPVIATAELQRRKESAGALRRQLETSLAQAEQKLHPVQPSIATPTKDW